MGELAQVRLLVDGVVQEDLNDGSRFFLPEAYSPTPANVNEKGEWDTLTPVTDEIPLHIAGCDRSELNEHRGRLNNLLKLAGQYNTARRHGRKVEIEAVASDGTVLVRALVLGGNCFVTDDIIGLSKRGRLLQAATARVVRHPVWEGPLTSITLTDSPANNGLLNYATLPALYGDLAARVYLRLVPSGAGVANAKRVYAWLRADGTPSNHQHILQSENYTEKDAAVLAQAVSNFSGGQGMRYTDPGDTAERMLLRWLVNSNTFDHFGVFTPLVRYKADGYFRLRFRGGVRTGSGDVFGPYTTDLTKTLYVDFSNLTEVGMLSLGLLTQPAVGMADQSVNGLLYELRGQAVVAGSKLDIDYVELAGYGEGDDGSGLLVAEFAVPFSGLRVYLDSRLTYQPAYLANGSDVKLVSATDFPEGSQLLVWSQRSGQRIYFIVTRALADGLKHDHTMDLALVAQYVPRYADLAANA